MEWIKWNGRGCPVAGETLVLIRLDRDIHVDEGRTKQARRADTYRWTKMSGITHYIPVGSAHDH